MALWPYRLSASIRGCRDLNREPEGRLGVQLAWSRMNPPVAPSPVAVKQPTWPRLRDDMGIAVTALFIRPLSAFLRGRRPRERDRFAEQQDVCAYDAMGRHPCRSNKKGKTVAVILGGAEHGGAGARKPHAPPRHMTRRGINAELICMAQSHS
jgi:hypothetical protein